MSAWAREAKQRAAEQQRLFAAGRQRYRDNLAKCFCAVAIAVCFWFAVPYSFPLQLDPDPMKAARNEAAAYQGNMSRQIAVPVILAISAYAFYRLPRLAVLQRRSKLLACAAAYGIWAATSATWSTDVAITVKRLFVFGVDAVFLFTLAQVASMFEIALFGFVSTGAVALIALIADLLVLRNFAPLDPDYRFMGVMTANFQAMNLFVCLACGLTLLQHRRRWSTWLCPLIGLFASLLWLTRARIGAFLFVAMASLVAMRLARQRLRPHGQALCLLLAVTLLLPAATYAIGLSGGGAVTSVFMMGRKDTENTASLSNRAPLWSELLESVAEHPVLGTGFEAFWSAERVEKISNDQGWVVPHAHNTYLDQVLSLGVLGCLLYAGTMFGACFVAWKRYRRSPHEFTLLPALLLTWVALLGVTESLPVAPYLPTLIAYACVLKMCMPEKVMAGVLQNGPVVRFRLQPAAVRVRGACSPTELHS